MTRKLFLLPSLSLFLASGAVLAQEPQALRARQELLGLRQELGLSQDNDLKIERHIQDHLGMSHTRLRQYYQGIKVWGGDSIAHYRTGGQRIGLTSGLKKGIGLFVHPVLSTKEALSIADKALNPVGPYALEPTAELVVYPVTTEVVKPGKASLREDKRSATDYDEQVSQYLLAYHVHTQLENGTEETRHTDFIVDAHTGAILKTWDSLKHAAATGTGNSQYSGTVPLNTNLNGSNYELNDVSGVLPFKTYNLNHGTGSGTGTLYTDADNIWGDGANYINGGSTTNANGQTAAVDAHYGLQTAAAFFKNVMGRNGIDGNSRATYARVHYSTQYDNAYWDDSTFSITFGDGQYFKSLESLDVAAHELSHGVTSTTADLIYSGESGGLNEATSDIFATFAVYYAQGAGNTGSTVPDSIPSAKLFGYVPWTVGAQLSTSPLRYMYKPSLDGSSPDAWSSTLKNLDVHYSSGPMNRAIYFLSNGATTSGNTSSTYLPSGMSGIGNDKAARIWYRALTTYLTSSSNYAAARTAAISAAKDLYGAGSAEEQAVWNAFRGINVGEAWTTPTTTVSISPAAVSLKPSASYQFTATVTNNSNTAVTWSVVEVGGGSVTTSGLYTAPAAVGTYHVKATSQGDSSKSATATVTVSDSTEKELVLNGGFESGTTSWSGTTATIGTWTAQPAYEGTKNAFLGGKGKTTTQTLYQTVTIPSTATSATLSFYLHIDTAETTTSRVYDKLVASLQNSSGTTLKTLATYSNLNKASGYQVRTFDVSAYKGQTVRVYFKMTEDSSLQSSFALDKVSLIVK